MKKPIPVELLDKYINGNCTETEVALVKKWYQSFDMDDDFVSSIGIAEEIELEQKIYQRISLNIDTDVNEEQAEVVSISPKRSPRKWFAISSAAAIALFLMVGAMIYSHEAKKLQVADNSQQLVSITNNSDQIYKSTLPDNSSVWVSPHSQLTYPKAFAEKARMVTISGKCFFEVTKNPARPFIITSRSIITKVWGTSFLVNDNVESKTAEVSVLTGKVSVSIKTPDNINQSDLKLEKGEVMIYPHQKVIYLADQHILKPEVIEEEPALQIWKRVNLSFENRPLKEIIPVLNSKFHIHIKVGDEKINHYILNADMAGFNLPDVLEALKKSLDLDYQIKDNSIELE